jgi:hypothetical protein
MKIKISRSKIPLNEKRGGRPAYVTSLTERPMPQPYTVPTAPDPPWKSGDVRFEELMRDLPRVEAPPGDVSYRELVAELMMLLPQEIRVTIPGEPGGLDPKDLKTAERWAQRFRRERKSTYEDIIPRLKKFLEEKGINPRSCLAWT